VSPWGDPGESSTESKFMEPTTQPIVTETTQVNPNKSKMIYAVIILVVIAIIVMILLKSKAMAPVSTEPTHVVLSAEDQQLNDEINAATTFDNENDLKQVDKEF